MTDFADEASERTEAQIEQALASRKPEGPKATGYCLECGEALFTTSGTTANCLRTHWDYERRWCDAQCRDDWERRQG